MPSFGYVAIDKAGVEVKGSINAENKEKVLKEVKQMGMIPIEIVEQSIWTRDIEFDFEKKGCLNITIYLKIPGYAPKYTLDFLKGMRTEDI